MSHISTDACWPFYHTIFPELPEGEGLDAFFAEADEVLTRNQQFVWLMEAMHLDYPNAADRQRYVDFIRSRSGLIRKHLVGLAIVMPSMLSRLMCRSIFLLGPPACPYTVGKNADAATSWCIARLKEEGLEVPKNLTKSDPNIVGLPGDKVRAIRAAASE